MSGVTSYGTNPVIFPTHFPTDLFCRVGSNELQSLSQRMAGIAQKDLCQTPFGYLCRGNLGIPRNQMPQVEGSTLNRFIEHKINKGIEVISKLIPAKDLIPVQKEMNKFIVNHFVDNVLHKIGDNPCVLPVLVSTNKDGKTYVIDGTHRSASCAAINGTQVVTSIADENVHRTLNDLKSFPGVFQIGLDVE